MFVSNRWLVTCTWKLSMLEVAYQYLIYALVLKTSNSEVDLGLQRGVGRGHSLLMEAEPSSMHQF